MDKSAAPASIDAYIASCVPAVRPVLTKIRHIVKTAVPDATEAISYRMPALKQQGTFLYFAAFKHHIGIYPPVTDDAALIRELRPYANEKGNLRFPLNAPMPYELIARIAVALSKQYAK